MIWNDGAKLRPFMQRAAVLLQKTQYTSGCEYLAGIGDRGYKIPKYNFFQENVDRKCKWIYNPDIVKNSLKSGRGSRKAAGIEDPGTVEKEEKMVIRKNGKQESRSSGSA